MVNCKKKNTENRDVSAVSSSLRGFTFLWRELDVSAHVYMYLDGRRWDNSPVRLTFCLHSHIFSTVKKCSQIESFDRQLSGTRTRLLVPKSNDPNSYTLTPMPYAAWWVRISQHLEVRGFGILHVESRRPQRSGIKDNDKTLNHRDKERLEGLHMSIDYRNGTLL